MKFRLLLFVFPLVLGAQASFKKVRTLFIGNSYTYVNNLPLLVQNLALAKGDTLVHDSYAPGGYTFFNHFSDATTKAKIMQGGWDYVVLQGQSQEPSFSPGQVSAQTLPYAIKLDSLVKKYNSCAHTVFYETWGRKNGDASNCAAYPPICTYTGMQNRLRDSYKLFADTVHDLFAPVGEAWRLVRAANPSIELYQTDESHPVLEGSYLAAAVFYEMLFKKTVLTSTYNPGIGSATLSVLNQAAHQLVSDSAVLTNIPKYAPKVSFSSTLTGPLKFQFLSATPAFLHHWSFGDGSVSSLANPSHLYVGGGTYTVSLTVSDTKGCKIDSVSSVVFAANISGLTENTMIPVQLYPNPCSDRLVIATGGRFEQRQAVIELRDLLGRLVHVGPFTGYLETSSLQNGVYYLKISGGQLQSSSCFIKNE